MILLTLYGLVAVGVMLDTKMHSLSALLRGMFWPILVGMMIGEAFILRIRKEP